MDWSILGGKIEVESDWSSVTVQSLSTGLVYDEVNRGGSVDSEAYRKVLRIV